jgi:hypothetical protein
MVVLLLAGGALAESEVILLDNVFPFDVSANGKAVAGNTGAYTPFRWTIETGVVVLADEGGSGTPDISADGNRVSAQVRSPEDMLVQAIWIKGDGWHYGPAYPAPDATGGTSCWGLSGDGTTCTGFYWRDNSDGAGSARTNTWSLVDGFEALPTPIRNCRGNDLSYDGSVVVGWSENNFGTWQPTVWENGTVTQLNNRDASAQVEGISDDGNMLWGSSLDTLTNIVSATVWQRTESGWQENILGSLAGSFPGYAFVRVNDMSSDGTFAVGYNAYDWYTAAGFVWTLAEGLVSANDFLAAAGVVLPDNFVVAEVTGCSDNGNVIVGAGYDSTIFPPQWQGFVITLDTASGVPDLARNQSLTIEKIYPNPFNPSTVITMVLEQDQRVSLEIYDVSGRMVRRLHDGPLTSGRHELRWDGRYASGQQASSGMYFARVRGDLGAIGSHRMMLVK